ncbi:hypothetical protein ACIQUG_06785 [Ensifer sp. NPDC090286]|uniref:hypothetical protein n=1 Tax=Ensifer sp. NPDC090286 TaxID=3363991 RepID=UPI00383BAA84
MTKTVILGPEYDQDLRNAVMDAMRQRGAVIASQNWTVAGSQEWDRVVATIAGRDATIEAETYIGLSITGDEEIVDQIAECVALLKRAPL